MTSMLERLSDASNSHDARQMALLFAEEYQSHQPLHPGRAFRGRAQVLANWTSVFAGVPDFTAELVAASSDGETEWGEWDWHGRHADGSRFAMGEVTIVVVRDGFNRRGAPVHGAGRRGGRRHRRVGSTAVPAAHSPVPVNTRAPLFLMSAPSPV